MFGKFTCRQCRRRFPYRKIVYDYNICLGCYAHAQGAMERNEGKSLLERETNILLISSSEVTWGSWWMLTTEQANYLVAHNRYPFIILSTCSICRKYYRNDDAGQDHTICRWCEKTLSKLTK